MAERKAVACLFLALLDDDDDDDDEKKDVVRQGIGSKKEKRKAFIQT